jgi:hypothetical protein
MSTRVDGFEPINLDGFDSADLQEIAKVLYMLGNYAQHKECGMRNRANGNITAAEYDERQCELIYKRLPEWARW